MATLTHLTTLLHESTQRSPDQRALVFLKGGEVETQSLTLATLESSAQGLAGELSGRFQPQERLALLIDHPARFMIAFFACQLAGLIAVPLPAANRRQLQRARVEPFLQDSQAAAVLCTTSVRERLDTSLSRPTLILEEMRQGNAGPKLRATDLKPRSVAYLQYSSGSTGKPKGICITHQNVLANLRQIVARLALPSQLSMVSWLPHHHDQGLVGALLLNIYLRGTCYTMTPAAFVQRPLCWLEAISKYAAHLSGGPNFAFELCVQAAEHGFDPHSLDLSCWRKAFNGAEAVRAVTLEAFCERFAPSGFQRSCLLPSYGLAEATLAVTMPAPGRQAHWPITDREGTRIVGCGTPMPGTRVVIVNPETSCEVPGGFTGEIWVAGPSIAAGYWDQPERSRQAFDARLRRASSSEPTSGVGFLRTGDFGFLSRNQLFVLGRGEDSFVVRGRNHFASDIEVTVEAAGRGYGLAGVCAFLRDGAPHPDLAVEIKRTAPESLDFQALTRSIAKSVLQTHDLRVGTVFFLRQGSAPRTTSGKLQRSSCGRLLARGELQWLTRVDVSGAQQGKELGIEVELPHQILRLLRKLSIVPHDFSDEQQEIFCDSLEVLRLQHSIQEEVGICVESIESPFTAGSLAAQLRDAAAGAASELTTDGDPAAPVPLCELQREVSTGEQLCGGTSRYVVGCALKWGPDVPVERIRGALDSLIGRHPILGSHLATAGVPGVEHMIPHGRVELETLSGTAEEWFEQAPGSRVGALFRVGLVREDSGSKLVLAARHLAVDHWSLGCILHELTQLCHDPTVQLPPARPYSTFARWYHSQLNARAAELRAFWNERLAGYVDPPTLTGVRSGQLNAAAVRAARCELPTQLLDPMRHAVREQGLSVSSLLLSAYALLVSRCTAATDLVIACPMAIRHRGEFANTVGYLLNTVPVRVHVRPAMSLRTFWRSVSSELALAGTHRLYPSSRIHAEVRMPATDLISPLCRVLFNFLDSRVERALSVEAYPSHPLTELQLTVRYTTRVVSLELSALADRYPKRLLEELLSSLEHLLHCFVAQPDDALRSINLLSRAHAAEPLHRCIAVPSPRHARLEEWLEHAADSHLDRSALRWPDSQGHWQRMTYRDLLRLSSGLARCLPPCSQSVVAIIMERSVEQIVTLLAVLSAGGTYLPIDPQLPIERIRMLLSDSGSGLVLADRETAERLRSAGVPVWDGKDAMAAARSPPARVGACPAALIYTSGSTGMPKGVAVPHSAYINRLSAMTSELRVTPDDVFIQKASLMFDVSVWEIFLPLVNGATLVVPDRWASRDPRLLTRLLVDGGVSIVHFVPSMLREWMRELQVGRPRLFLRACLCSGEPLSREHRDTFRSQLPGVRLLNLYGPTECAIDVTLSDELDAPGDPPIGRPTAHVGAYVLDTDLRALPRGVTGQLCIAGPQLALGYWGRGDLTAERFVPAPEGLGERIYLTGDRVRWDESGQLQYCGRIDHQLKVNGVRVEPAEIRTCLCLHPAVIDAEVVPITVNGEAALAAAILCTQDIPEAHLRQHLAASLPAMMHPRVLRCVRDLPLSRNGKSDRVALIDILQDSDVRSKPEEVAGTHDLEAVLRHAWHSVLDFVPDPDVSFFAAGGDSIRAIRLCALLRNAGWELSVADVYRLPTRSTQRNWLAGLQMRSPEIHSTYTAFSLLPESICAQLPLHLLEDAYPLSMLQRAIVSLSERDPGYEVYVSSLHLRAPLREPELRRAVQALVDRHSFLRSAIDLGVGPEPLQRIYKAAAPMLAIHDWRALPRERLYARVELWRHAERRTRFQWDEAPLVRFCVHQLNDEEFVLHMTEPALDGWCVATALTEIAQSYSALLQGDVPALLTAPLPSYGQFVASELAAMSSEHTVAYWREQVAASTPQQIPRWPIDRWDPPAHPQIELRVPSELCDGLSALAQRESLPVKSIYLAAFAVCLGALRTARSVVALVECNGRLEERGGDAMLGAFNNIVPLNIDLDGASWRELLHRCFACEARMQPHRRYPFASILHQARARQISDALFVYTDFHILDALDSLDPPKVLDVWASDQTYLPLTVHVNRSKRQTRILLDYQSSSFSATQVEWVGQLLMRVLANLGNDIDRSCMEDWERLRAAGARAQWEHCGGPFVQLVERWKEQQPDTIAIRQAAHTLSYRELWELSGRHAALLKARYPSSQERLAIVAYGCPEAAAAILGAWRLHRCCVLLDPDEPASRIVQKIVESGARVVLTNEAAPALRARSDLDIQPLTLADHQVSAHDLSASVPAPRQPAYIIHTSGSSGTAKAVMVSHAAFSNYARWSIDRYGLRPGHAVWSHSSLAFDFTLTTLLVPLAAGSTVECVAKGDLEAVAARVAREDVVKLTPSQLQCMADSPQTLRLPARIILGGERLYARDINIIRAVSPRAQIFNEYGPTEATVGCSVSECEATPADSGCSIGYPIAGGSMYVLNDDLTPALDGATGEIFIAGAGLAEGYDGRGDLTADRFIPDPFATVAGSRMYRTGDQARYTSGNLICIGRRDRQLKVRGHRVEPGEIEHALNACPGVASCAVTSRDGKLLAWVTGTHPSLDVEDVHAHLMSQLPPHMWPAQIYRVSELPLSANGKIDLSALREGQDAPLRRVEDLLAWVRQLDDDEAQRVLRSLTDRSVHESH